jgi:hypothetical protein
LLSKLEIVLYFCIVSERERGLAVLSEAAPRKSASPQQSLKVSFRFVFGLRDL